MYTPPCNNGYYLKNNKCYKDMSILKSNDILHSGEILASNNNKYTLTQKDDCNLELTDDKNNSIWTSKTKNKGTSCYTKIDNDNKLVVYDSYNTPLFTSKNTRGSSLGGISFNLNDDRNMTITDAYNNILWNSETTYHPPPSLSPPQLQKKTIPDKYKL